MRAENGMEELSEMSGGLMRSRWRREGPALGRGAAKEGWGVSARRGWAGELGLGGGLLLRVCIESGCLRQPGTGVQERRDEMRGESLIPPHWGSQM